MAWKLFEGDCLEIMPLEIEDNSIDLIVTDPPYLINYRTSRRSDKNHDFCSSIINDDNPDLIKKAIKECYHVLKDDSALYMFCSPDTIDFFKKACEKYFKIKNLIIWVKNNWTAGDLEAQYGKQYEMIIYANKGRKKINGKRLPDVWFFNRVSGGGQLHQNQKPVELIKQMIEKSSQENDVVLDPFAGSGSVGVATEITNRNSILIEKELKYCTDIKNRLSNINLAQYQPQRVHKPLTSF